MSKKPSKEQVEALEKAKQRLGRTWREKLSHAWMSGNYRQYGLEDVSHLLQQVRNEFGPSWLHGKDCQKIL